MKTSEIGQALIEIDSKVRVGAEASELCVMINTLRIQVSRDPICELTGDPEFDQMLADCISTMSSKGKEYTIGSQDRLANFRRVGEQVDEPMEKVWFTYFYKHYSAVVAYIKNGCKVQSNEPIQSRIMDCIVYLLLFHKMSQEIERSRK